MGETSQELVWIGKDWLLNYICIQFQNCQHQKWLLQHCKDILQVPFPQYTVQSLM